MVWKENGKYGIHTGRTLRKPSGRICSRDRGFLMKTVANTDINFTDQDFKRCLRKFPIQDGFSDEEVVEESRNNQHWGWGRGGFSDNSVLYSIAKRKRWLLPTILREKIPEDYDSENDYEVVLVERVSVNNSSWFCQSPRLKHGDCSAVLDGADLRKPKRRKFAHVGDLRNDAKKTEIVYEVNHTESLTSWPSYLQHDWRESRDQNKARCKEKGKKNKRRMWGEYRKSELDKQACESQQNRMFYHSVKTGPGFGKQKLLVLSTEKFEYCSSPVVHENDFPNFNIGDYICESLKSPGYKNPKKLTEMTSHKDGVLITVNPASSQPVTLHGKGTAVYIDPQKGYHDNNDSPDFVTSAATDPLTTEIVVPSKTLSLDVVIESEKLNRTILYEQFGETYQEGTSLPRRFSICHTDQLSKFVFTCQQSGAYDRENGTEKVTVTVVGDALPSKKSQDCKEFLSSFFGVYGEQGNGIEEPTSDCSAMSGKECRQTVAVMPLDLLYDINRWSYKASLPSLAVPAGLHSNTHCNEAVSIGDSKDAIIPDEIMCEICCCEFYHDSSNENSLAEISCTAMKLCSHWFCDNCWKSYLSAEVQQGKTVIKCPDYNCDTLVDDVTIMAFLPDRFPRFLTMRQEKALETNAEWKWCPGNKCNLVVMTTSHEGSKETDGIVPVPICCECGHNWCFGCQEEPHWPASCAEAAFFRSQTETYEKIVRSNTGGITSVNVKKCPHCRYPIEKNKGCQHMTCGMCKGEFCWICLESWADHKWDADCAKKTKQEEEVELINHVGSTRFNSHLRVAIANRIARATPVLYEKYSVIKKLEEVLQSHYDLFNSRLQANDVSSATNVLLSLYNNHKVPLYLKASADFKFQAHFVIEGVSILMAVSKTKSCHNKLKRLISMLLFVVDRLETMASNRHVCTENDKVHFKKLLDAGKHCINSIRKLCSKVHVHSNQMSLTFYIRGGELTIFLSVLLLIS